MIGTRPAPAGPGPASEEYAVRFDEGRERRVLVLPAFFDEANKLRHFTVATMRLLAQEDIDSFLPDLPGCNESVAPLVEQDIESWREAALAAAAHFGATHVLAIRGGALVAPPRLPGWRYGATSGRSLLNTLLRARVLASKEARLDETREELLAQGRSDGLTLGGHTLSAAMIAALEDATPTDGKLKDIAPSDLQAPPLWLRAEPGHDAAQAEALAGRILEDLAL